MARYKFKKGQCSKGKEYLPGGGSMGVWGYDHREVRKAGAKTPRRRDGKRICVEELNEYSSPCEEPR